MPIIRNKTQKLVKTAANWNWIGQTLEGRLDSGTDLWNLQQVCLLVMIKTHQQQWKQQISSETVLWGHFLNNFLGSQKTGRGLGRYVAQLECVKCVNGPEHFTVPISDDCGESQMDKIVMVQLMALLSSGRTHLAHRLPMIPPLFWGHGWLDGIL